MGVCEGRVQLRRLRQLWFVHVHVLARWRKGCMRPTYLGMMRPHVRMVASGRTCGGAIKVYIFGCLMPLEACALFQCCPQEFFQGRDYQMFSNVPHTFDKQGIRGNT